MSWRGRRSPLSLLETLSFSLPYSYTLRLKLVELKKELLAAFFFFLFFSSMVLPLARALLREKKNIIKEMVVTIFPLFLLSFLLFSSG